ncbi:Lysophospholipase L1 [Granulicella rosea]|uniref:Lysophospholipase L1 n=1 Tax=Granulicella rosea TaxID=474952 RepID=A0A239M1T2_9BACT|nr:SGNH/GDSL hydrolase family protein [Granulicella rosea]SNT36727.1 Lysophospholipase L1 [Granulicella rosea]
MKAASVRARQMLFLGLFSVLLTRASALAQTSAPTDHWIGTWASSQMQPYGTETLPAGTLNGATLRQVVHLSAGGERLRLRLANTFGNRGLELGSVHIALRGKDGAAGTIDPATDRALSFHGQARVYIPMGADYLSDPIAFHVDPLSDLVVTMTILNAPETPTLHAGARATSFLLPGDHVAQATLPSPQTFARWYFLAGVDVNAAPGAASVVTLGDSITDGHGATTDANDRWPDVLARRLAGNAATASTGVLNEGIGGNRVLADGIATNALARFDRDVLSLPGASYLLVLEGVNDLGGLDRTQEHPAAVHQSLVEQLEGAYAQMAARAHSHGIKVYGATVTPYTGSDYYHPSPRSEADRQALNLWIRTSGVFDAVVDFDQALRDPARPDHLLPAFDSGDHLHPSPAGYKRMGEEVPLKLFNR